MIPPQLIAGAGALILIAGFLTGWTARDWKSDADQFNAQAAAVKREDKARDWGLTQGKGYADLSASLAGARGADRTTIERIYQNAPPVPADCAAPAAVVRVLENGVRRANAATAGQSGAALPGTPPAPDATGGPATGPMGG